MATDPPYRRLRVYTLDPGLAAKLDTAMINQAVVEVRWEENLRPGPVGDYLEVVDFDPASDCFYAPVDLDDPRLLAQDGMAPSEGEPGFHQQMVYAVAMRTIQVFEQALGRKALWSPRREVDAKTGEIRWLPVRRLRIYPHALREANAYYSPEKKALLFGYFPAVSTSADELMPGGLVFTCLSYDVVAHETTHALLDGLHRYFAEPSNPDVLAFHEGFADVVAMFQHFTHPEALEHQVARTRGDLSQRSLLGALAHQFGQAIGKRGALRDAIGHFDEAQGRWVPHEPGPGDYQSATEPHDRGAVLVAAMFDAFAAIYKARTADLMRIATAAAGGELAGELHPDLVRRLSAEAAKVAGHVLRMAIRALDYCPPVDISFGEYLRALVTADEDLVSDDRLGYRIAVVEAFRRRGIYPRGVRTLSPEALLWDRLELEGKPFEGLVRLLKRKTPNLEWQTRGPRTSLARLARRYQAAAQGWLCDELEKNPRLAESLGLARGWFDERGEPLGTLSVGSDGKPAIEVHSVRSSRRPLQDGSTMIDLVVEVTQRRRGYVDEAVQRREDARVPKPGGPKRKIPTPDFVMRGGCTLLIDSESGEVRYCIRKRVASANRLARQRGFAAVALARPHSLMATYLGDDRSMLRGEAREPFATLHRLS